MGMTEQEALKELECAVIDANAYDVCKKALEKQIAKKPYYIQYDANPKIGNWHCSNCDRIANDEGLYCKWCGTKLDWGNEDAE